MADLGRGSVADVTAGIWTKRLSEVGGVVQLSEGAGDRVQSCGQDLGSS